MSALELRRWAGKLARAVGDPGASLYPARPTAANGVPPVTSEDAMRNSAVWSSLRVRANLVSSLPVRCWRTVRVDGESLQTLIPLRPIMLAPSTNPKVRWSEWLYSSQIDLDRYGNAFGLIRARDALGLPAKIDLVCASDVRVLLSKEGVVTYKIGRDTYSAIDVWHEKQYTVAGLPVGLSPISYAAMTISQHKSAQQFSINWFTNNAMPAGILRNKSKTLKPDEAQSAKDRFKAAMQGGGDIFVAGEDWEFSPVTAQSNDSAWLDSMNSSATDIARFFDVPGDIIGAPTAAGTSIVYANIVQRFVQLLTVHLGPTLQRRQEAFSFDLMPQPQFCEFDTERLLQMDPASMTTMLAAQVKAMIRTPNEVRNHFFNLGPLSDQDRLDWIAAFGKGAAEANAAATEGAPAIAGPPADGGQQ